MKTLALAVICVVVVIIAAACLGNGAKATAEPVTNKMFGK